MIIRNKLFYGILRRVAKEPRQCLREHLSWRIYAPTSHPGDDPEMGRLCDYWGRVGNGERQGSINFMPFRRSLGSSSTSELAFRIWRQSPPFP